MEVVIVPKLIKKKEQKISLKNRLKKIGKEPIKLYGLFDAIGIPPYKGKSIHSVLITDPYFIYELTEKKIIRLTHKADEKMIRELNKRLTFDKTELEHNSDDLPF